MQILARAGEDFPFFSRLGPSSRPTTPGSPSPPSEEAEQTPTPGVAPLEFVSSLAKATSAIRSASSRARRALVELKDDIIDFGGSQQQALSQGPGWALPWAAKTEEERAREEIRRRLRELSQEPFRFLVPQLERPSFSLGEPTGFILEGDMAAAAAETALEDDPFLKALKDEVVPRMLSETEFWHRYFTAVRAVEVEVFEASQIAARLSATVPDNGNNGNSGTSGTGGESMASFWLGGRRPGGASRVRPFDVDGEEAGGGEGLVDARRSVSEQWDRDTAARGLVQPFGSFIESEASAGDGAGASLPRQLSSVSAEELTLRSLAVVAEGKGAPQRGGPGQWIRHTVSGIGAMSGLALGESREVQHKEAEGPKGAEPSGLQSFPSTAEGLAPVEQEEGLPIFAAAEIEEGQPIGEPAFLRARDSLPCSSALQQLSSACASATAFKSCLELLTEGCDSSPSYPWPAFAPLSAVGDALRHSISGQHGQSPTRGSTPTATTSCSPGEETPTASTGLRLPIQEAIIAALFSQQSRGENQAGVSSEAALPAPSSSSPPPRGKSPGRTRAALTRTMHGAPAGSFVADLALAMASLSSVREMAQMWLDIVEELREHFRRGKAIPAVPLETEHPDLQMCEVMQHIQLLNLCMQRRERRAARLAADTAATTGVPSENSVDLVCLPGRCAERPPLALLHVQVSNKLAHPPGDPTPSRTTLCPSGSDATGAGGSPLLVSRRRGVKSVAPGLLLLETGEALCIPETQDTPMMTETSVRESEELIISTGSMGSGCKQLFSDMQAFKAANPGCLLEDFVRWYSPPDWSPMPYNRSLSRPASEEEDPGAREDEPVLVGREEVPQVLGGTGSGCHGQLSGAEACTAAAPASLGAAAGGSKRGGPALGFLSPRMVFAGNLWQELWDRAEAIPAMDQPPLYDVEEGAQASLAWLQDLAPAELLEQLFVTLVAIGLASAQDLQEASEEPLRTSLAECVRYASATCCRGMGPAKQQWVCTVYRVMETARAAVNAGTLSGFSEHTRVASPLFSTAVTQPGPASASTGASGRLGHDRCGAQQQEQEPPHLSLQQEATDIGRGGLMGFATKEASAATLLPPSPLAGEGQAGNQACGSEASAPLDHTDQAHPTPSEDPLSLPEAAAAPAPPLPPAPAPPAAAAALAAAAAVCEERREDPSAGIRQAAAAIFSKLRAGPGWSRPSVSWSNLEGAAAPFKAAADPAPKLAPGTGAGVGQGEPESSGCVVLGPDSAPQRCSSETLTAGMGQGMEGVSLAGEGRGYGQLAGLQAGDMLGAGQVASMGQLDGKAVASCVPSGLATKEREPEGEWVII